MPEKKVLLILKDDGDVKGRVLKNSPKIDPALKWLLVFVAFVLVFVCVVILRPPIPVPVSVTPISTSTPLPLRVDGPPQHSTIGLAQPVRMRVVGAVEAPITRLVFRVNGIEADAVVPTPIGPVEVTAGGARRIQAVTTLTHVFNWTPESAGEVVVEMVIYTLDGRTISTPPMTYYVTDNRASMTAVAEQLGPPRAPTLTPPPWLSSPTPEPIWTSPPPGMPAEPVWTSPPPGLPVEPVWTSPPPAPPPSPTPGWPELPPPSPGGAPAPMLPTSTPDVGAPDVSIGF